MLFFFKIKRNKQHALVWKRKIVCKFIAMKIAFLFLIGQSNEIQFDEMINRIKWNLKNKTSMKYVYEWKLNGTNVSDWKSKTDGNQTITHMYHNQNVCQYLDAKLKSIERHKRSHFFGYIKIFRFFICFFLFVKNYLNEQISMGYEKFGKKITRTMYTNKKK